MSDLKERYIYAVVKGLPRSVRSDIERELDTLIDDMLEARCGEETPTEKDLRVVLTELGTPAELFRKYSPDSGKALIGEKYYPQYKRLMTIVLCAVALGMLIAHIVLALVGEITWGQAALNFADSTFTALLAAFGAVTIAFAILERSGIKVGMPSDTIENLPAAPKRSEKIPLADSIIGIVLSVAFAVLFLAFPHLLIVCIDGTACYPIFLTQTLQAGWMWILLFAAAGVVRNVFRLIVRRRSVRVLIATAVCDFAGIILACVIFLRSDVMNPAYLQAVSAVTDESQFVVGLLLNFNVALLVVIAAAILIDLAKDAVRTLRSVQK